MLEIFTIGFPSILNPTSFFSLFLGVVLGIIFGAIPGLTGSMALALCLPLTYKLDTISAFALIMGIFIGGCSGGLISATLLGIPGTPSSITTTFDAYPMTKKGEAGKALGVGIVYSFLGGLLSFIVLFTIAPAVARFAVKFGPIEYFSIALFSLTMISGLSGKSLTKGLVAGFLGITLSFIGISPVDATPRLTFGLVELNAGLSLLPALIGLFAVSELMKSGVEKDKVEKVTVNYKIKGFGFSLKEFKEQTGNFLRSAAIGTGIGILPGIGGITSNMISYVTAKKRSKHPEKFGTGIIDGIVASETANNASIGGALMPLITLGIPGDGFTAIVLGAFMIHGLTPGPLLMKNSSTLVYAIFASLLVANVLMILVEFFGMRIFVRMLSIPKHILMPFILVLTIVGAIGMNNRVFDAWTVFVFGLIGFIMNKLDFPINPVILGFILGPIAEVNLRRGLMLTQGSILPFLKSPISAAFLIFTFISIFTTSKFATKKVAV